MKIIKKVMVGLSFTIYVLFFYFIIFGGLVFKVYQPQPTDLAYDSSLFKEVTGNIQYAYLMEERLEAFDIRLALIKEAEVSVDVSYYAVHNDEAKDIFYGALIEAANRGVQVRFIIDGFIEGGILSDFEGIQTLNNHENIEIKYYEPINIFLVHSMQNRLHDKLIIVDAHYGIIGGRNIGNRYYFEMESPNEATMDRDVLIFGDARIQAVDDMQTYYEELFNSAFSHTVKTQSIIMNESKYLGKYHDYIQNKDFNLTLEKVSNEAILVDNITFLRSPLNRMHKEPVIFNALVDLSKDYNSIIIQSPYIVFNKPLIAILRDFNTENITFLTNSMHTNQNVLAVSGYLNYRNSLASNTNLYEYQGDMN
ncbi:MAG: phospholipase D-like domain-containing protein, partial [Candidatus Izemoplasmataceae bacterium]